MDVSRSGREIGSLWRPHGVARTRRRLGNTLTLDHQREGCRRPRPPRTFSVRTHSRAKGGTGGNCPPVDHVDRRAADERCCPPVLLAGEQGQANRRRGTSGT